MDAEKLLAALSPDETRELAAAFPAGILTDEIVRRGIEVPIAVGANATQAVAEVDQETSNEQDPFQVKLSQFLDPEVELTVLDQLEVVTEFLSKLGHKVPELTKAQQLNLLSRIEDNPSRRVMPTPLLDIKGRRALAERAKELPGQKFNPAYDALWTPGEGSVYGKLLNDPESVVRDDGKDYGLLYKTANGEVVSREAYVASLIESGQAALAEDGTIWTFPVMDVRVRSERTYGTAGNLHEQVDPIVAPESLLATQLLHQANGAPNSAWAWAAVDFANEAVYELDKKGNAKALVYVAGVGWYPYDRQVGLSYWGAGSRRGRFGVRGAESGI
ncbi:MAG: hypothetical protein AAB971_01555 [Patescibacteria group bacterium]